MNWLRPRNVFNPFSTSGKNVPKRRIPGRIGEFAEVCENARKNESRSDI